MRRANNKNNDHLKQAKHSYNINFNIMYYIINIDINIDILYNINTILNKRKPTNK